MWAPSYSFVLIISESLCTRNRLVLHQDSIGMVPWAEDNADNISVVLLPYLGVLIPLNLFLYHDVIDKRWRNVRELEQWSVAYGVLATVSLLILVCYAIVQFAAEDFKEAGAAVLSLTLAVYGLYLFSRQRAILRFFHNHLQRRVDTIVSDFVCYGRPTSRFKMFFPGSQHHENGPTHGNLSSVFLDDNYPGEGPRVTWLKMAPEVKDWTELMVRVGLWIRLAVVPTELSFYSALRPGIRPGDNGKDESASLWTISSLKLAFLNPPKASQRSPRCSSLKYFIKCTNGEKGTLITWLETLRLAPASEWAQALSELPSAWIEGVETAGIAWEVFLALALHCDEFGEAVATDISSLGMHGFGGRPGSEPRAALSVSSRSTADFKQYVEAHVRETLVDHEGHVTTAVLMGAFPEDEPEPLKWLKGVDTFAQEAYRLARLMRKTDSMPEEALCVGVDLVVAMALLLNAKKTSFEFSPEKTWSGLQDVLGERRKHVLVRLESEADMLLRESLARRVRKGDDVAQASYSLGKFLDQVRCVYVRPCTGR